MSEELVPGLGIGLDATKHFSCPDIEAAKARILEPEAGLSTEERWEKETPWIVRRLVFEIGPILDFGCGIGRVAKEICGPANPVTGVDISATMRSHAVEYVNGKDIHNPQFRAISPEDLDREIDQGYQYAGAVCAWVLQHVLEPGREIARLAAALRAGAPLYIINRFHRAVPGKDGLYYDDQANLAPALLVNFDIEHGETMPLCKSGAYFARFRRKRS